MKQFNAGDIVRDRYGKDWEVIRQDGCQVFVYGATTQAWIHPSNLTLVFKCFAEENV